MQSISKTVRRKENLRENAIELAISFTTDEMDENKAWARTGALLSRAVGKKKAAPTFSITFVVVSRRRRRQLIGQDCRGVRKNRSGA